MGIVTNIMVRLLGAQPFENQAFDALAERMKAKSILKKDPYHRYYKSSLLPIPCLAYSDALVFNANYYQMLSPDEALAVGAHEFNHLAKKHILKRLPRTVLPAAVIAALVGYLLSANSAGIFFISSAVVLSFFLVLISSYYVNAKYLRKQETESDLSAVEFVNGAAMISALSMLRPQKTSGLLKLMPHTHPAIEQRIQDIQAEMNSKNSFNLTVTYGNSTSNNS